MPVSKISFAATGFELVNNKTIKRDFFSEMSLLMSWVEQVGLIEPYAPLGKTGRVSVIAGFIMGIIDVQFILRRPGCADSL